MKTAVYNQKGEEIKKIDLPKDLFGVKMNDSLVHQVLVSQLSNRRQGSAHTKERDEVRGGGRKPWRQKGTGRARHGSTRSPIWKGGGVTFGPRNDKNYKKDIPQEMRKKALFMVLSSKFTENEIVFVDSLKIDKSKTKVVKDIIEKLPLKNQTVLMVLSQTDKNTVLGARNILKTKTIPAKNINVADLLSSKNLIISEDAVKVIKETFLPTDLKTKEEKKA